MCRASILGLSMALLLAPHVCAQEPTPTPAYSPRPSLSLAVHGLVDVYYAWNSNRPANHESFFPGTGTTAKRADEFALNLAALDLVLQDKTVGLRLIAVAGNGAEVVHEGEPAGEGTGREVIRHIYQASINYVAPIGRGVTLEAGIYPSHVGFETFLSKDNWNYTRAWQGEFSPYYQTGLKVSAPLSDHWSVQLHVLNGWQIVGENNDAKTIGTQVTYATGRWTASFNTLAGPELPGDNDHWRTFGDLVLTLKTSPWLELALVLDAGYQSRPGRPPARWQVATGYARYSFSGRTALAARAEVFSDPENGISGFSQTLVGGTLTLEHRPHEHLVVKLEGRYDHSTQPAFSGRSRAGPEGLAHRHRQGLLILGAVATF